MKPGIDAKEYNTRASELLALAQKIRGLRSIKSYTAEDGKRLALVDLKMMMGWPGGVNIRIIS